MPLDDPDIAHGDSSVLPGDGGYTPGQVDGGPPPVKPDAGYPPVQIDSSIPPLDASVGDAALVMDGARVDPPDAQQPRDAGAPECVTQLVKTYDLFVFDSQGPTMLIGGQNGSPQIGYEFTGTVAQQGQGFPVRAAPSGTVQPEHPEQFRFLRVSNAGTTWTIALRHASSFGVRDGAQVEVKASYEWGGFSPVYASLSIRVDGQLALFYGRGGALDSLPFPAELDVRQHDANCQRNDICGSWASYSISVASGNSERRVIVPGNQEQVGPYTVTHAADDQQLPASGPTRCNDWFVSRAELLAVRSQPLGPVGGGCRSQRTSSLPGVRIEFPADVPCRFTLAQAAAGVEIPYTLVVDSDLEAVVRTHTPYSNCLAQPWPADLFVFEDLAGNGQHYALTQFGLCPERPNPAVNLRAGRYPHAFKWDGVNWGGPSDTSLPKGPAFPAGAYTLRLSAEGTRGQVGGPPPLAYEVAATLEITLVP